METPTNPETQNSEPVVTQSPKNSYKILFFLSLGLFLITASVLITLLITQKSSNPTQTAQTTNTQKETETVSTETVTPEVTDTEISPTASESEIPPYWKTYTNTDYSYSIKYPSTWTVDLQAKDSRGKAIATFLAPGMNNVPHDKIIDIQVSPTINVSRVDSADYINNNGNVISSTSSVVVNGVSVDTFILNLNNGYDMVAYIEKNSETYSLSLHNTTSNDKEYIDDFNLMLSTFKFN